MIRYFTISRYQPRRANRSWIALPSFAYRVVNTVELKVQINISTRIVILPGKAYRHVPTVRCAEGRALESRRADPGPGRVRVMAKRHEAGNGDGERGKGGSMSGPIAKSGYLPSRGNRVAITSPSFAPFWASNGDLPEVQPR
jgi:hypothetical protein